MEEYKVQTTREGYFFQGLSGEYKDGIARNVQKSKRLCFMIRENLGCL